MDYRETIDAMRSTDPKEVFCHSIDAADAIETLLAERDAVVEDLRGLCWYCIHGRPWEKADPLSKLTGCEVGALSCAGLNRKCPYWQWRGPR